MIDFRIGALCVAAIIAGVLFSAGVSAAPAGSAKVVILRCAVPGETIHLQACDKSAGVETACPALGSSCAEAIAMFQSSPSNLQLLFVSPAAVGGFWYTLGGKKFD
jgi:hypothetical protein